MESFGDLLNKYIQRTGISDAELARSIGVSRQTVFRWREGLTTSPRYRDDVLVIARKLRLTPDERDELLLAAGFRPEENLVEAQGSGEVEEQGSRGAEESESEVTSLPQSPPKGEEQDPLSQRERVGVRAETPPSEGPGGAEPQSASSLTTPGETAREAAERRRAEQVAKADGHQRPFWGNRGRWMGVGGLALVVIVGLLAYLWRPAAGTDPPPPDPSVTPLTLSANTPPTPAEPITILITHFANYAGSEVGYNVAGRLAEALQREIDNIRLAGLRLEIWPEPVDDRQAALRAGRETEATLVIYGEYDVGRVVVKFAHPANESIFADPALRQHVVNLEDLTTAINSDLPQQVRSLALIALGQIYLDQDQADQALIFLTQAHNNLQGDPDIEANTWAVANFFLGIAYQNSRPANLDKAIAAYSEAIDSWPEMIASRLNRIAAYEARRRPGDFELALADADALVKIAPEWPLAYNNRASIRLTMGGEENMALALADLEQTIALNPNLPEAYLNRAIVLFGQGQTVAEILPDVEQALALRPTYGNALNLLCWGYGLEAQPEKALPYCQQAVESNPDEPLYQDSRGLVYALLGETEAAIADFEVYAAWLEAEQPGADWERDAMRRRAWIEALEQGENPFTTQILAILRAEVGE